MLFFTGDSVLPGGKQPRAEDRVKDSEEKNQRDGRAERQTYQTTTPLQVRFGIQYQLFKKTTFETALIEKLFFLQGSH